VFVTTAGYLFEGPIDGSSQAREVHPPLTTGGAVLSFAARGRVVVYLADQDTDTVRELYVSVVTRPRFAPR
jgi:hypothetical protein